MGLCWRLLVLAVGRADGVEEADQVGDLPEDVLEDDIVDGVLAGLGLGEEVAGDL